MTLIPHVLQGHPLHLRITVLNYVEKVNGHYLEELLCQLLARADL